MSEEARKQVEQKSKMDRIMYDVRDHGHEYYEAVHESDFMTEVHRDDDYVFVGAENSYDIQELVAYAPFQISYERVKDEFESMLFESAGEDKAHEILAGLYVIPVPQEAYHQ